MVEEDTWIMEINYCYPHDLKQSQKNLELPIYDPQREKLIFARMRNDNPGPLDDAAVVRLFERVIDESRSLERARSRKD